MVSKAAKNIVRQKEHCDCSVMFHPLLAWKKASRPRFTGLLYSHKAYMLERQKISFKHMCLTSMGSKVVKGFHVQNEDYIWHKSVCGSLLKNCRFSDLMYKSPMC